VGREGALLTTAVTPEVGTPVVVGLRPQDCRTDGADGADGAPTLPAEVKVWEHLLEFGLATMSVAGLDESVVVQVPADVDHDRGDVLRLTADPERVYLFDADNGVRIR